MKKILILFVCLIVVFTGVWVTKSKTPAQRPDSYANGIMEENAWWNVKVSSANIDKEWILDPEIPKNYIPVPGEEELYMVVDEDGKIIQYRQRVKQADGSWAWKDVNPDIPDNYEPVPGVPNVYKVTNKDGSVSYFKYIRNDDDTFAFVPCDEYGNYLDDEDPKGEEIPDNYIHLAGNVYAVTNENGVVIGYKERKLDDDGNYHWSYVEKPSQEAIDKTKLMIVPTVPAKENKDQSGSQGTYNQPALPGYSYADNDDYNSLSPAMEYHSDGTYTETESYLSTENQGGYTVTYKTTVVRTYDASGNLLSTKKDGPYEVDRQQVAAGSGGSPDPSSAAGTLQEELARVTVGVSFDDALANQILAKMNAERAAAGLPQLSLDTGGNAYMLARTRAGAMATYDYSDYVSPIYGTLSQMCSTYGIANSAPSENTWRTGTDKTADAINAKFMSMEGSKVAMLSGEHSQVGIAIAQKNGYYYICEVFIN